MGDILRAYDLLNRTFKLGLTKAQIFRAEQAFKLDLAQQQRFRREETRDANQLMADWELKTYLVPRARAISATARASMEKAVAAEIKRPVAK